MTRLFAVVVLVACSGRAPAPTGPTPDPSGSGSAMARGSGEAVGSGSAAVAPSTGPSEAECRAMLDHVIEVDLKERPADQQLGPDAVAQLREETRTQHMAGCLAESRTVVACVTAATTVTAIKACVPR